MTISWGIEERDNRLEAGRKNLSVRADNFSLAKAEAIRNLEMEIGDQDWIDVERIAISREFDRPHEAIEWAEQKCNDLGRKFVVTQSYFFPERCYARDYVGDESPVLWFCRKIHETQLWCEGRR